MQLDGAALLAIVGMAAVTYLTRIGGFVLLRRIRPSAQVRSWLKHLPSALMVSILAPLILAGGAAEVAATVITIVVTAATGNVLLGTASGVGVVMLIKRWG